MSKPGKAIGPMKIHPVAELIPPMTEQEFRDLVEDIGKFGQQHPILKTGNQIIDGRHRYRACLELGITPKFAEWDGHGSLTDISCTLNVKRRHLSPSQKAAIGAIAEDDFKAEAEARQKAGKPLPANLPEGQRGEARELAAKACGVSARYISDAKLVRSQDPRLFDQLIAGTVTISQAKRAVHRDVKRKTQAKAPAVPSAGGWEIVVGDNLKVLPTLARRRFRLAFADPQYNIGIDYGKGSKADQLPRLAYLQNCKAWMQEYRDVTTPDGTVWVLISDENAAELCLILKELGLHMRGWIKWYETFGVNCANSFNRTSRHLLYFVNDPARFVFNREAFTRPSARQTVYKDKRAAAGGKLWDDVWQIPRLVDNAKERIPGFPTQLPLALVRPIVEGCTEPGDEVLDAFNGSGTTGEACVLSGRRYFGIDILKGNVELARMRLHQAEAGERPA